MGGNRGNSATPTSTTELKLNQLLLLCESTKVPKESGPYKKDTLFKNYYVNN